jgi:hypothetical protein
MFKVLILHAIKCKLFLSNDCNFVNSLNFQLLPGLKCFQNYRDYGNAIKEFLTFWPNISCDLPYHLYFSTLILLCAVFILKLININ